MSGIKKGFLWSLIGSITVTALISIFIFLFGEFGELELNLLQTTLTIGTHSLVGLGLSAMYERETLPFFSASGIVLTVVSFINSLLSIWGSIGTFVTRTTIVLWILFFGALHVSLLLLARSDDTLVNKVMGATIFIVGVVALLLIIPVVSGQYLDMGSLYMRILGAVAVLDGLGSLLTPILLKVRSMD